MVSTAHSAVLGSPMQVEVAESGVMTRTSDASSQAASASGVSAAIAAALNH
jgi:hypothetical protein